MFVDVELHGELTRGQTIADRRLTAVDLHNADVCMDIDRPRFEANFLAAIKGRKAPPFRRPHSLDVAVTGVSGAGRR